MLEAPFKGTAFGLGRRRGAALHGDGLQAAGHHGGRVAGGGGARSFHRPNGRGHCGELRFQVPRASGP